MGFSLFKSSSSCSCSYEPTPAPAQKLSPLQKEDARRRAAAQAPTNESTLPPGNPNPYRFTILRSYSHGPAATAVEVSYPDAKNYEGRKIMVYAHSFADVSKQSRLDPHFCEGVACVSPIARFEPTARGWSFAIDLVDRLAER